VKQTLPTGRKGQALALALTVLVLMLIFWGAVLPLSDWYAAQAETLSQQEALATRMARIAATLPALRAQEAAAPAAAAPVALLQGETDAIAAANLQERLQALAAAAGTSLSSVEMLPVDRPSNEPAESDRAIRLRLMLNAPWATLIKFLDVIEAGPPLMLIDDLRLEGVRLVLRDSPPLQASLTVTGFRHPAPDTATASQ
jgi:type II secretory pathway component PulM